MFFSERGNPCGSQLLGDRMIRRIYKRERGAEYWFPRDELVGFFKTLPVAHRHENLTVDCPKGIAIMTHDDFADEETQRMERAWGINSTYFLLSDKIRADTLPRSDDLQLHFDKGKGELKRQMAVFEARVGTRPAFNRNHRFWWRADHLDLAYLSLHGFRADSSRPGFKPYRLCVEGRLLPIWEIPYAILDDSVERSVHAGYSLASEPEHLFTNDVSPVVAVYHPVSLSRKLGLPMRLEEFHDLGKRYGYSFLTVREFYDRYLARVEMED